MSRKQFYQSKAWKQVRINVWLKQNCLCDICHKPVYVDGISEFIPKEKRLIGIVHHKEHLNETNYLDDSIALNEDNLVGVCIDCHNKIHFENPSTKPNLVFDKNGYIIPNPPIS